MARSGGHFRPGHWARRSFPAELTQPAFRRVFYCPGLVCVRGPASISGRCRGEMPAPPDSPGEKAFVECAPDVLTARRWRMLSWRAMAVMRRWLLPCDMSARPVPLRLYVSWGPYHIFCRGNAGVWRFPCLRMIPQGQPQPHSRRRARFSGRCRPAHVGPGPSPYICIEIPDCQNGSVAPLKE